MLTVTSFLAGLKTGPSSGLRGMLGSKRRHPSGHRMRRRSSVKGIIRRTCSIHAESGDIPGNV